MGSSGGGSGNAGMMAMMGQGTPMPGLPIAGKDSTIGDPYDYGKFQSFLPEIQAEGENPMATGLRPEMFEYRSPGGKVDPGVGGQIQELRDQLAKIQTGQAGNQLNNSGLVMGGNPPGLMENGPPFAGGAPYPWSMGGGVF